MKENKNDFKPYIPADQVVPEFTVTALILGILLAVIFGAANAYLGLRVGMTVSASIPAWVLFVSFFVRILSWKTTLFRQSVQPVSLLLPEQSLRSLLYSYGQKKVRLILLVF